MRVPCPSAEWIVKEPPRRSARSRMESSPIPPLLQGGGRGRHTRHDLCQGICLLSQVPEFALFGDIAKDSAGEWLPSERERERTEDGGKDGGKLTSLPSLREPCMIHPSSSERQSIV